MYIVFVKVEAGYSWSWTLSKSYVVSSDKYGPFAKCNYKKQYRIVKRIYKCRDYDDLSKFIITQFNSNKKATGRHINVFSEAEDLVTATYEFSNGGKDKLPSGKSRIYPNTSDELKRKFNEGQTPKRAIHEILQERGSMDRVKSANHIPSIYSQSHSKDL